MRETRYLWVKNFPENIQEEDVANFFACYGRIEKVKLVPKRGAEESVSAVIAFVDIRSAQHVQNSSNVYEDRQLRITYSDPAAMSSVSGRRGDQSPMSHSSSSSYRTHSSHREGSRSYDGHSGERSHSGERHRGHASPISYKQSEYSEGKSGQKRKELKSKVSAGSRIDRKIVKAETPTILKKKHKRQPEDTKLQSKVSKVAKQKEYVAVKKKSSKKKRDVSSSEDDHDSSSSSGTEDESSQQSSSESSATSESSSSSNSDSTSSRSSIGSSQGEQKLVTIVIKKLPSRPSVNNLREGIYHEFKKCGKVKSVVIRGDNNSRNALVLFRNSTEANKAISHAKTKLLFGAAIEASLYDGEVSGKELQECGGIIDEFHPRASRTLFVGNLDKTVQYSDIQNIFVRFGEILAIDIKKVYNVPQYAFLQYTDIASVVKAIQKMDGELLGRNVLKLGFGKTVMSSCVWVEGVTDGFTEHYLASCFHKYGAVKRVIIDRTIGQALVFYLKYENAQKAMSNLRGRNLNGSRLKLDYASHELVELFLTRMQRTGQAGPSFESIRSLLLPTPSGPGLPNSNPGPGGSRSSRSGSSHPYPSRSDPYYDPHLSRYHPPPHGYDAGPPPRGDWRPWDDRSRSRPVYQSVSPRGRRYNEDRGDYYHRDAEHFDRISGRYEQDYRGPDYIRKDDFPPRAYGDDYHRTMKPRDPEHFHMTPPPGRVIHRRSRSISPRLSASSSRARGPDFDSKLDPRPREHRDHSVSRGRSPIKSPSSKEGRITAAVHKYRDHGPRSSPNVYRRDDERRVELVRDPKSLPGSPRSAAGSMRGKGAGESPDSRSMGSWPPGQGAPQVQHDIEMHAWDMHNYERSRSETPTRDENTATIGEVIIKQPSGGHSLKLGSNKSVDKRKTDDVTVKIKKGKSLRSDTRSATPEKILQRKFSPSSEIRKKKHKAASSKEEKLKKYKAAADAEKLAKKIKLSSKDEKRRKQSRSETKPQHSEKSHGKPTSLIKREYSPSSLESGGEQKRSERHSSRRESNADARIHRTIEDSSKNRQERPSKSNESDERSSLHKKRRQSHGADSDHNSPYRKDDDKFEPKLKRSFSDTSDDVKASKRSRRGSAMHEAPLPVASQSFMSGVEEEGAASGVEVDSDAKEPSTEFRPKVVVREEVIEVEAESEEDSPLPTTEEVVISPPGDTDAPSENSPMSPSTAEDVSTSPVTQDTSLERKRKSRWEPKEEKIKPKVAIAQPFHTSLTPFVASQVTSEQLEEPVDVTKEARLSETAKAESQQKLSRLEEEKEQLQVLLMKLDAKQALGGDEASQVADIYLADVAGKIKAKQAKKEKKQRQTPKSETSSPAPPKLEEDLPQPEAVHETKEVGEEAARTDEIPEVIEEQTIVEEEVTSNDEMPFTDSVEMTSPNTVPERKVLLQTHSEEMEGASIEPRSEEVMSERRKKKYQRSLLRKQKKERERHKRKVEKMRGPSQGIISSIVDEEDSDYESTPEYKDEEVSGKDSENKAEDIEMQIKSEISKHPTISPANAETKVLPTVTQPHEPQHASVVDTSPQDVTSSADVFNLMTSSKDSVLDDAFSKSDASSKATPQMEEKTKDDSNPFAVPFLKDNSTPGSTPKSAKTEFSPSVSKTAHQDENSKTSESPFTPKSAAQADKMSQSSGRSSTSLTPLTPSPKPKAQPPSRPNTSKHPANNDRRQNVDRRRPPEHSKPAPKPENRGWKARTSHARYYTNLTVSREADHSKPLDKKELERLRIEVARVKKELDREMSQEFLSPTSEGDPQIPPMSPILKSPSIDIVAPDLGRSGASPVVGMSPSSLSGSSSSLTERMKLLGKVKKKFKSEEEAANGKLPQQRMPTNQEHKEFSNSRFFKSSIFDQDSQRLSHLQNVALTDPNSKSQNAPFPIFDSGELPEDKPLFSDIVSKTDNFQSSSIESLPKNEFPLSSDVTLPAAAESASSEQAGRPTSAPLSGQSELLEVTTATPSHGPSTSFEELASERLPPSTTASPAVETSSISEIKFSIQDASAAQQVESFARGQPVAAEDEVGPVGGSTTANDAELPASDSAVQILQIEHHDETDVAPIVDETKAITTNITESEDLDFAADLETTGSSTPDTEISKIDPENAAPIEKGEVAVTESSLTSVSNSEIKVEGRDADAQNSRNQKTDPDEIKSGESAMDISQLTVSTFDSTPGDITSTQESYIGDISDVVTTEVVSSETDYISSQPEISDEFSVQEVIAEEAPVIDESFLVIETNNRTTDSNQDKPVIEETLTPMQIKGGHLPDKSQPSATLLAEATSVSAEMESPAVTHKTSIRVTEPETKSATSVAPTNSAVAKLEPKNRPKTSAPSDKEMSKKPDSLEKTTLKASSKSASDEKEKKLAPEKKAKLEKIKKERKEEHLSKSDKTSSKSTHSASLPNAEKHEKSLKKMSKDEKHKTASSSGSKPKLSDSKPGKPREATPARHESAHGEDKHKKKESKTLRKPESSQISRVSGADVKPHSQQDAQKLPKPSEKSKPTAESEKKMKLHKHKSEKNKEHKEKHAKDDKAYKKIKEEFHLDKHKPTQILTKKHSMTKEHKKEKLKAKESSHKEHQLEMKMEKMSAKPKHSKPHADPDQEPARKKLKISDSSPFAVKQKPLIPSSSDSNISDFESGLMSRKGGSSSAKAKMKAQRTASESFKKAEKLLPAKPLAKTDQKSSFMSSDSESSDHFDDFLSQISGGTSKSSFQRKSSSKAIYSSSDLSDEEEPKLEIAKSKVEKVNRSEQYDSDKSEDYSVKKHHSKSSSESAKSRSKQQKSSSEKRLVSAEKLSKKSDKSAGKSSKSSGKDKKIRSSAKASDSEALHRAKMEQKRTKHSFHSDDNSEATDEETRALTKPLPQFKKSAKPKKPTESYKEGGSVSKVKKSKSPASTSSKTARKLSSSSTDLSDYSPPPVPSSSLLTVETIKHETRIPPKYLLETLEPSDWDKKHPKPPAIYTSSSSDFDEEDAAFREITAEDKIKFFGSSGSSSDSDAIVSKPNKTKLDKKHSISAAEQKEKDAKAKKEDKGTEEAFVKSTKSSKSNEQRKDPKSKHQIVTEKAKHSHEHKQKSGKKEEKSHQADTKTREKHQLDSKIKEKQEYMDSKTKEKSYQADAKIKEKQHQIESKSKEKQHLTDFKTKEKQDQVPSRGTLQEQKFHKKVKSSDEKLRKHDEKYGREEKHKKQSETHPSKADKHKKEKSRQTTGEKQKEKIVKPESSKPLFPTTSKTVQKEKKAKEQSISNLEKQEDKAKTRQKETTHPKASKHKTFPSSSVLKEPPEKKDLKVKKESKDKVAQGKSSAEPSTAKIDSKKSSKLGSPKEDSSPDVLSQGVVLPSLRIDEELKMEKDEPGRSFFCSDDSDEDEQHNVKSAERESVQPLTSRAPSKPSLVLPSESSQPPVQKSLFSPTKEDAGDSCSSFEETIEKFSKVNYTSPSRRTSHGSLLLMTSPSKTRLDSESEEPSLKQRKSSEPPTRTKRLSSYEQYKLEQERKREQMKELEKISQQREEEAVRSIMAGDNAIDGLSGDSMDYFISSAPDQSVGESSLAAGSNSVFDDVTEPAPTPQHSDSFSEGESKKGKEPIPEPRSTAEEDELAAALRSIEGFGDFDAAAKDDLSAHSPFQPQTYPREAEEDSSSKSTENSEGAEEAASAASALLQESTSQYDVPHKEAPSQDDCEPTIQLPSVRYEQDLSPDMIAHKKAQSSPRKPKEVQHDPSNPPKKSDLAAKEEKSKFKTKDKQPAQPTSRHDIGSPRKSTLQSDLQGATDLQGAADPLKSERTLIQEKVQPQIKASSVEAPKPVSAPAQPPAPTGDVTSRPFVSRTAPREPPPHVLAASNTEAKPPAMEAPKLEAPHPQVASRRPSSDQTHPSSGSFTHQLPRHMSVAPMHEAVLVAKPPHSSAAVSAPQPGFHIPPSSMSHPPPTMVSPHPTLPQERPQAQMQTPMHRLPQAVPVFPQQQVQPRPVHPQASLKRSDSSGQLRPQHISSVASNSPALPQVAKTSASQQQYLGPSKERAEKPGQGIRPVMPTYHTPPGGAPTGHTPPASAPSGRELHQDIARGGVTTQAGAKPPQIVPHFAPHQSMFYPTPNLPMYALPPAVPFGRSPYPGFNMPLQLPQGLPPQQQPHTSAHLYSSHPHNPYMDLPKERLTMASPGIPTQGQEAEKTRQISPGRGMLAPPGAKPQDFQAKMHPSAQARPPMLEQIQKPAENRPPAPMEAPGRHSISMAGGDSMLMVDQHFKKSGVRLPPTSSIPSPASSLSASAASGIRPPPLGSLQHRPPQKDSSVVLAPSHPHATRTPIPQMLHEPYRLPLHAPREQAQHSAPAQAGPSMARYDAKSVDPHHQRKQTAMEKPVRQEEPDNLQDLFKRYPIIWQGKLALKNDSAAVQIHFVSGNMELGQASLPKHMESQDGAGLAELRIVQRMRTNAEQMNSLRDRMTRDEECCFLLALPCGRDHDDILHQTKALCTGFIEYLQQKEVAGIVNVEGSYGSAQTKMMLVLHVFPPSEFTSNNLQFRAPDLLSNVADIQHLMIVVTPA